jgi:hypothetical protein
VILNKIVSWPRTDSLGQGLSVLTTEQPRAVTVRHERAREGSVERLSIFNNPEDGKYSVEFDLVGVLPNGVRIPIETARACFDGRILELDPDTLNAFTECWAEFDLPPRYVRRLLPVDPWGPCAKQQRFQEVQKRLAVLGEAGVFSREHIARLTNAALEKLGLDLPG